MALGTFLKGIFRGGKQTQETQSIAPQRVGNSSEVFRKYIAVVGLTGSGLSQFIHDVTGAYSDGVAPYASMRPFTTEIRPVEAQIEGRVVTLIDTPGFDYTAGNHEHATLKKLAAWFKQSYGSKVKLNGVIYMHNIWDRSIYDRPKFTASQDLERLCGPRWHEKVILVNSHWGEELSDDGEYRENELKEGYWKVMLKNNSRMRRYESPGNRERAREILEILLQ